MIVRLARMVALSAALIVAGSTVAAGESVEDFYKGKTVRLIVGSGAGGGSDVFSRIFAKYFGRHMPGNPNVIVQNVPAAGGVVASQQIFNTAPKDGTVFASVMRTIPLMPLLTEAKLNFEALRMSWLGSLNRESNVIVTWHTSTTRTLDDVFKRVTVVGTSGAGSDSEIYTLLLNRTLGSKFKLVGGYPGGPDIDLAMERGEVEGRVSITWTSLHSSHADWLRDHKVNIIAQMGLRRDPELADVPNVLELVKNPLDRQVYEFLFARQEAGRPFVAPPDIPPERLEALRAAFAETAADPAFVGEITARGGSVELMTGTDLQDLIAKLYRSPPEVIAAVKEALGQ